MSGLVEDINGAEVDIRVWDDSLKEHDERLKKVLERARYYDLKLGPEKMGIPQKVSYLCWTCFQ